MNLSRARATRSQKRTFQVIHPAGLVGDYLHWLKLELDHPSVALILANADHSVEEIIRSASRARRGAKVKSAEFDETWCIFDGLSELELIAARQLAHQEKVRLATNTLNIDQWLLLHFEDPAPSLSATELRAKVFGYLSADEPESVDFAGLSDLTSAALERAVDAAKALNPDTSMHELVLSLQASRHNFRPRR